MFLTKYPNAWCHFSGVRYILFAKLVKIRHFSQIAFDVWSDINNLGVGLLFLLLLPCFLKLRQTATVVFFYHFAIVHPIFCLTEHIFLTQPSKLLAQKPSLNILIVNLWHASFQNFNKNFSLFWSHHHKVFSMQRMKSMSSRKTTKVYFFALHSNLFYKYILFH